MPVTSRVSFTPLVVTEFSVQQDWARTYAGTHTTTEQRRQRLLSFHYFLQNLDLGTKPKKTVLPFEPRAPKICHISTVNSTSSNCMEHACRLVIKKITVYTPPSILLGISDIQSSGLSSLKGSAKPGGGG